MDADFIIVISVVASVIGIVWLVWSMMGGHIRKPRVRLESSKIEAHDKATILRCTIINDPIYFGPLRWLGIKRSGFDEVFCLMTIIHLDTGTVIVENSPVALHKESTNMHVMQAPLAADPWGLYFPIAAMETTGMASVNDEGLGTRTFLAPGTYRCLLFVHADEIHCRAYRAHFAVGGDADTFYWAEGGWRPIDTSWLGRLRNKLLVWQGGGPNELHERVTE